MAVFAAWLNHDDSRSINNLDTLVRDSGRTVIRHNLLDFGSTLGSGTLRRRARARATSSSGMRDRLSSR